MKYSFNTDYSLSYPLPACAKANPPCPSMAPPPRLFKKGDIIEGQPQGGPEVHCIKAPCITLPTHVFLALEGATPAYNEKRMPEGFMIPINVLSPVSYSNAKDSVSKANTKDAWTGGVEWDKVFSFKNLFWLVVLVYLAYLFMKHVLPLAKKSFQ
jgi:hypothetical protein